jgi:ABC-type Zn2+ transport system substrate-binding protein/surface adhesin
MEVQEGGCQPPEVTWIGEELEDFLYRPRHRLAQCKATKLHALSTLGTPPAKVLVHTE